MSSPEVHKPEVTDTIPNVDSVDRDIAPVDQGQDDREPSAEEYKRVIDVLSDTTIDKIVNDEAVRARGIDDSEKRERLHLLIAKELKILMPEVDPDGRATLAIGFTDDLFPFVGERFINDDADHAPDAPEADASVSPEPAPEPETDSGAFPASSVDSDMESQPSIATQSDKSSTTDNEMRDEGEDAENEKD